MLSNCNTENICNMEYMFYGCYSLKYLNISNFSTKNVINMNSMFSGCTSLVKKNIIIEDEKLNQKFNICIIY